MGSDNQPLAVAIVSGGLDSVTLACSLSRVYRVMALTFDYGQRHRREIDAAAKIMHQIGATHDIIDLRSVGALLPGSALTDPAVDVPEGHYNEASMRGTVVPNRNAIMLSIAYGVASAHGADVVALAVHAGDHFIYPDCRPSFLAAFEAMERQSLDGFARPILSAPFVQMTKAQIVTHGAELGVPFADTWTCYKGGMLHCGVCGSCSERRAAFVESGVADPTVYATQEVVP